MKCVVFDSTAVYVDWDITQRMLVVTDVSGQPILTMGPIGCPEMSVKFYAA